MVLSRGAFSKFMSAENHVTKKEYALKILRKDLLDDYNVDAPDMGYISKCRLNHPFLACPKYMFANEQRLFFAYPYIRGV